MGGGESICECKNSEKLWGMKAREMLVKRPLCLGTVMFLGFFFFFPSRPYKSDQNLPLETICL